MPTPRENTSIVKAPVLFRLPHLQRAAAAKATIAGAGGYSGDLATSQVASGPAISSKTAGGTAFIDPSLAPPASVTPQKSTSATVHPEPPAAVAEESFFSRWGLEIKRSVILLAAIALLWGAWAMGQKSATVPNESNLVEVEKTEPDSNSESVAAAVQSASEPSVEIAAEPRIAHIVEPRLSPPAGSSSGFSPVSEPPPSFNDSDDSDSAATPSPTALSPATPSPTAKADFESDFSQLSPDSLVPPGNSEFYGDYDLVEPTQSSARKPPMTTAAATSNQTVENPAGETALPPATNFVQSLSPEMPGFDPNNIGNVGSATAGDRPVLSSTPNGILDWSRYLPGAGSAGPIRAVSATEKIGGAAGETQSAESQAIYLDKNEPGVPNVGVAPFYR